MMAFPVCFRPLVLHSPSSPHAPRVLNRVPCFRRFDVTGSFILEILLLRFFEDKTKGKTIVDIKKNGAWSNALTLELYERGYEMEESYLYINYTLK